MLVDFWYFSLYYLNMQNKNPRILKFRVWDIEEKYFLPSYANRGECFYFNQKFDGLHWFIQCERLEFPKRFNVTQFTGLKDKNGREIYGGDIIEYTQCLFNISPAKFPTKIKEIKWNNNRAAWTIYETEAGEGDFEVIGNIFENPNLLK